MVQVEPGTNQQNEEKRDIWPAIYAHGKKCFEIGVPTFSDFHLHEQSLRSCSVAKISIRSIFNWYHLRAVGHSDSATDNHRRHCVRLTDVNSFMWCLLYASTSHEKELFFSSENGGKRFFCSVIYGCQTPKIFDIRQCISRCDACSWKTRRLETSACDCLEYITFMFHFTSVDCVKACLLFHGDSHWMDGFSEQSDNKCNISQRRMMRKADVMP